jgi:hypothetical protein
VRTQSPENPTNRAMHRNQQNGDGEREVTELHGRHLLASKKAAEMSGPGFSVFGKSLPCGVFRAFLPSPSWRRAHAPTT